MGDEPQNNRLTRTHPNHKGNHATSQINIFSVLYEGKDIVMKHLRIKQSLVLLSTMLILVAACSGSESADSTSSTNTSETPTTTKAAPTTTQAVTETTQAAHDQELTDKAWASVVTLFSALNSGDDDAVLGLFAPNVAIWATFGGEWPLKEWEMVKAWDTAQGTVMTPPDCSLSDEAPGESVTISCRTGVHDAPSQAVSAPPVPTDLIITVTADGIGKLVYRYGSPNFNAVAIPMTAWMSANHPDVIEAEAIGIGNWTSVEEATTNGVLMAEYSAEWATYLEENGCAYNQAFPSC